MSALLVLLLLQAAPPLTVTPTDLDGDGTADRVTIAARDGAVQLRVGGATLRVLLGGNELQGAQVVDIDPRDRRRELVLHTLGQRDEAHRDVFLAYDGRRLRELGRLRSPTEVPGNGGVLEETWMGFWKRRDKWVLEGGALRRLPQALYAVGVQGEVKRSFPLTVRKQGGEVLAQLRAGSTVEVIAADVPRSAAPRYLVRSAGGLLGWCEGAALENLDGLPWAG